MNEFLRRSQFRQQNRSSMHRIYRTADTKISKSRKIPHDFFTRKSEKSICVASIIKAQQNSLQKKKCLKNTLGKKSYMDLISLISKKKFVFKLPSLRFPDKILQTKTKLKKERFRFENFNEVQKKQM